VDAWACAAAHSIDQRSSADGAQRGGRRSGPPRSAPHGEVTGRRQCMLSSHDASNVHHPRAYPTVLRNRSRYAPCPSGLRLRADRVDGATRDHHRSRSGPAERGHSRELDGNDHQSRARLSLRSRPAKPPVFTAISCVRRRRSRGSDTRSCLHPPRLPASNLAGRREYGGPRCVGRHGARRRSHGDPRRAGFVSIAGPDCLWAAGVCEPRNRGDRRKRLLTRALREVCP